MINLEKVFLLKEYWITVWLTQISFFHFTAHIFTDFRSKVTEEPSCLPCTFTLINCTCFTHFTTHVSHVLPYTFYTLYHTRFQRLQIGIGTIRGSNYPLAVLCQDLGLFTLLAAVLWIDEVDHFRFSGPPGLSTIPGWYRACGIGKSEQQVHLQPLCCIWSSGCSFDFFIPVSSLQYQLIGKLKGRGSHPHRWAGENWSDVCW